MAVIDRPLKMSSQSTRAQLTVPQCSMFLKRLYFLQRELVLMQAGWVPGMQHWESKLLLPEFLWQDSLIANELRQRVLELRYPEREIDLNPDEMLVTLWRRFRDAPNGLAFVQGLRSVLKPLLNAAYQRYLDQTDHLDDGPTVRIVEQAMRDNDQQIKRWDSILAAFPPEQRWLDGLKEWALEIGDLFATVPAREVAFDPLAYGGRTFSISRLGERDPRFNLARFPWPDALDPSVGPGEGMQLQVRQAVHHINEIWAAEMAAACLFDLAEEGGHEFLVDAARWCYDEVRHCRMGFTRLTEWGIDRADIPLGAFSYDAGAEVDAITRLGIIFYFESTYIHTKWQRTKIFADFGDRVSSHDMDFDWADEQIHAHYGARWLKFFLEKRSDSRRPVDFREQAEACVTRIRERATKEDRRRTAEAFQRLMSATRCRASPQV